MRRLICLGLILTASSVSATAEAGGGFRYKQKVKMSYRGGNNNQQFNGFAPSMMGGGMGSFGNPCCPPPVNPCCAPAPMMQAPMMQAPIMPAPVLQAPVSMSVPTVQYRREAQVVEVPVTTYRQVTVDEGGYQSVWVPKMVTKNVAETTVQKQVQYRDVAYQTTQQVSMMPTPVVASAPGCCPTTAALGGIAPHSHGAITYSYVEPLRAASVPALEQSTAAQPQSTQSASNDKNWQPVPQRSANAENSNVELQKYEQISHEVTAPKVQRSAPSAVRARIMR